MHAHRMFCRMAPVCVMALAMSLGIVWPAGAEETDDEAAVRHAIGEYVAGWREGDVARLSKVFELDHGYIIWQQDDDEGTPVVQSRTFRKLLEKRKPNPGYGEPYEILHLEVHGGSLAFATVRVERAPRGSYVDHFTLHKLGDTWRITTKTYVWHAAAKTDPAQTSVEE
jgi:hypothetical protein